MNNSNSIDTAENRSRKKRHIKDTGDEDIKRIRKNDYKTVQNVLGDQIDDAMDSLAKVIPLGNIETNNPGDHVQDNPDKQSDHVKDNHIQDNQSDQNAQSAISRSRRAVTTVTTDSPPKTIIYKNRAEVLKNNYADTIIEYKLSNILKTLCNISLEPSGAAFKSLNLGRTPINFPATTNLSELFSADLFAANFTACWPGEKLESIIKTYKSTKISGMHVKIQNDLAASTKQSTLNTISAGTFRSLFCLFMSYYYGIAIHMCMCYPQNTAERLMLDQGLGKNCYSAACRSYLENNMHTYDSVVNSKCDAINQTAIVLLNNFILNSDASINIVQTINNALA